MFTGESAWENQPQQAFITEQRPHGREIGDGILPGAVFVQQLTAADAHLAVFFHEPKEGGDGAVGEHRVGVEEQGVAPLHQSKGKVIGSGKAEIFFIGDNLYRRKLLPDHGNRVIA